MNDIERLKRLEQAVQSATEKVAALDAELTDLRYAHDLARQALTEAHVALGRAKGHPLAGKRVKRVKGPEVDWRPNSRTVRGTVKLWEKARRKPINPAVKQGRFDYQHSKERDDNPYDRGTDNHKAWDRGWMAERRENDK